MNFKLVLSKGQRSFSADSYSAILILFKFMV